MKVKKWLGTSLLMAALMCQTGCGGILNAAVGNEETASEKQQSAAINLYEITDADRSTTAENLTEVNLEQFQGDCFYIEEAGTYSLSGETTNSKIVIDVDDDQVVHLILDGLELNSEEGAAIYAKKAAKVVITLTEGTESTISDSANYDATNGIEACIFSNCDLTINGQGILYVDGLYHDAIRSKDCVKILDAGLYVKAKNNGIRGNDGVTIENAVLDIQSEGIGIKTESEKDFVVIKEGQCNIIAGENAIWSKNYVWIEACKTTFRAVEESIHCSGEIYIDESES